MSAYLDDMLSDVLAMPCGWKRDREFKRWFALKHDRPFCPRDPQHLVGSDAHQRECVPVEEGRS